MSASLFVAIKIHDPSWTADHQANVPAIMRKHGGGFVAVSDVIKRHEGTGNAPDHAVLMRFPSMKAIEAFVTDADDGPYRAARLAASTGDALAFATPGLMAAA